MAHLEKYSTKNNCRIKETILHYVTKGTSTQTIFSVTCDSKQIICLALEFGFRHNVMVLLQGL
jgi:hypothetical protein